MNLIGPLPFFPDNRGDYMPPSELRRRRKQCQAERDRLLEALGWWEDAPLRPPMLDEAPAALTAAA